MNTRDEHNRTRDVHVMNDRETFKMESTSAVRTWQTGSKLAELNRIRNMIPQREQKLRERRKFIEMPVM